MQERQHIVLASRPNGIPTLENFALETTPLPECADGEVLVKMHYFSLDPYMRGRMDDTKSYAKPVGINETMEAEGVGTIVTSRSSHFHEGDMVVGRFGWTTHGVLPAEKIRLINPDDAPISTSLGVLGMPGFTGWFGLNIHGRPQKGETLVVGAASGAVGSMVGQLAKIYGLHVVGVAGGPEKCAFVTEQLGFDACIDHRQMKNADEMHKALSDACPHGIDIYYENVGGVTMEAAMGLMNRGGRVPVCGMISFYNLGGLGLGGMTGIDRLPKVWRSILVNQLSINGFIISNHYDHFPRFHEEVLGYINSKQLIYKEDIAQGIAQSPEAFLGLLQGKNFGKQLVAL